MYSRRLGEKIIHRDYGAGKGVKNLLTSSDVTTPEKRPRLPKQELWNPEDAPVHLLSSFQINDDEDLVLLPSVTGFSSIMEIP